MSTCLWMTMHRWTASSHFKQVPLTTGLVLPFTRGAAAGAPQDDSISRLQKHGPSLLSPFS